jgi:molybdopterin/thiamine biosynthesis adenylyltransferase
MPTYRDYFSEIKKRVKEATPQQVADLLRSGDIQLADVREKNEWDEGHLPNAVHLPKSYIEQWAEDRIPDKDKTTILYCAGGVRSAMAADTLAKLGYSHVISMSGGFNRWKDSGLPWKKPDAGIVDSDVVDATNLQRQILHTTERIGEPKTESARQTLEALNPDVKIVGYQERLTSENIDRILSEYDVVVDGADNFPTRYLLNDASVKHNKPVVHGSIYRFEGQVTVFKPGDGPCYRCLFPTPPPPELAPSCAEAGVLGVLPGVIGTIQANEVIKLLLGIGEPLVGRYLLFDALEGSFREVRLRRDPKCPVCGENPTITEYIDYEGFCASPSEWQAQHAPKVSTPAD